PRKPLFLRRLGLFFEEQITFDAEQHQVPEPVAIFRGVPDNGANCRPIGDPRLPSERVKEQPVCQIPDEHFLALKKSGFEFTDIVEARSCELSAGIDFQRTASVPIMATPAADGVEAFQREAGWIDLLMARPATAAFAMFRELVTDGLCPPDVGFDRWDIW